MDPIRKKEDVIPEKEKSFKKGLKRKAKKFKPY
jgi:hypothetical protein